MKYLSIVVVIALLAVGCNQTTTNSTQQISSSSTTSSTSTNPISSISSGKTFTMTQVSAANSITKCYSAINGSVYDLTKWINMHPGGSENILSVCGKDGSAAFNNQHSGQGRPEAMLASFKIGTLKN